MFTGIISGTGQVVEWRQGRLGVAHPDLGRRLDVGGSVAVNGVCLRVVEVEGRTFFVDVVPDTHRRTNLGSLVPGNEVNLELPLTLAQGLDGHLVQGHVDGVARGGGVARGELGRGGRFGLARGPGPDITEKGSLNPRGTE